MDVVELADTGDASQRHLGERRSREPVIVVGLEPFGGPVHLVTPRPERAATGLGPSAQGAMERVAVRVGEAGQRQAGETDRVLRRFGAAITVTNRPSTTSIATDESARRRRARARTSSPSRPTRSTNAVIRSTNSSRWCRRTPPMWRASTVGDPVDEQHAVEVVALVLPGARRRPRLISSCATPSRSR